MRSGFQQQILNNSDESNLCKLYVGLVSYNLYEIEQIDYQSESQAIVSNTSQLLFRISC